MPSTRSSEQRSGSLPAEDTSHVGTMQETDPELTILKYPAVAEPVPPRRDGEPCLVQIYPVEAALGARYVLQTTPLLVGREVGCDVRVSDRTVSRQHARIEPDADGHRVVDLESTNGTFINDVRVSSWRLQNGDSLTVGPAVFRFLAGGNPEAAYHQQIHRLAVLDPQTGIHNQRHLLQVLERELHRAVRYQRPLAMLLFDVDTFKLVNDAHGHLAGDFSLREMVTCVQPVLRREAVFCRYGGDEFAVVLPETTLEDSVRAAERIRLEVERHSFDFDGRSFRMTVSIGVATASGEEEVTTQELIRVADESLYQAKRQGRNRVVPAARCADPNSYA